MSTHLSRRALLSTAIVGASAFSGCLSALRSVRSDRPLPTTPEGRWTQHGADAANTFTASVSAPPQGNLAWTSAAFTRWTPVLADGTVYTTNFDPSHEGSAIALDAQDGSEQWRTTLGGEGDHGRALVDGRLIVADGTELHALNRETGEIVWQRSLEPVQRSGRVGYAPERLAVDDRSGTIVVPSRNGLNALGATDGEPRWTTTEVSPGSATPAIHDGTIYLIDRHAEADSLAALAVDDGSIRWTRSLAEPVVSADPVVTDHGVLIVDSGSLAVYDADTGSRRRVTALDAVETTATVTVAADAGTAFVATREGLFAVDIEAGTTRLLHDGMVDPEGFCVGAETVVAMVDGSPYVADDNVVTITAFDRNTGEPRWNYVTEGFHTLTIPPILADGAVFFATSRLNALAALGDVSPSG